MTQLDTALAYAARGWPVFPCKHDKTPLTKDGFKAATTDPEQVASWWQAHPGANIGIACGAAGLVVVDVDVKNGAPGLASWQAIVDELGVGLVDTAVVRTPSGGRHYVYRANGHGSRNSAGKLGIGIDVRADGGYIVAPGSETADGPYEWLTDCEPAELPAALADRLTALEKVPAAPVSDGGIPEGQRNATLARLAGAMRRPGMTEQAMVAALLVENKRCAPPLPEREVCAIAASVGRYEPTGEGADEGHNLASLDWQALLRDGVPEVEYIAEPYFPKGARIWVWGATGTFKSLWCLYEAAQLSRQGVRVSYFSEENPLTEDLRRLSIVRPDPAYFRMFHRTGVDLFDPEWVAALLRATTGDALTFLDSWTDLWSGDESDNRMVQQFDARVLKPLQAQGVTPVVVHHTGHRQMFSDRGGATAGRGASALGQKADVTLEFKDAGAGRFIIVYGKCRIGGVSHPPCCFEARNGGDGRLEIVEAVAPEELAVRELAEKMVEAITTARAGRLTSNELRAAVGGSSARQKDALVILEDVDRVRHGVEKVETSDGKRRDAKVWRPAGGSNTSAESGLF